jgi:flagellar hook-basal body complex protein FliE
MLPIGSVDISSMLGNAERLPIPKNASDIETQSLSQAADIAQAASANATGSVSPLGATDPSFASAGLTGVGGGAGPSFSSVLENAVNEVDSKMKAADTAKTQLLTGETGNVHQAMIATQEASVAFSLMVEVRNKLVDSYQELMRMTV